MKKDGGPDREQLITHMEEVIKQLRQAQDETSAAAAAADALYTQPAVTEKKKRISLAGWKQGIFRLSLLVLAAVLGYGGYALFAAKPQPTVTSFITGVQNLATLATAEAYVMTTVDGKDNKLFGMNLNFDLPGTKRSYLFVVPAKMLAGVDLKNLTSDDVRIDHAAKTIALTLPHASFVQESVQLDKLKVYTDAGLFRASMDTTEGIDLIKQGAVMERLREEASASGLLQTAEANAVKALQSLYQDLGYEVSVTFQ